MLGAIIGDIVGSRWEFNPTNDYDFEWLSKENGFTDDTIMSTSNRHLWHTLINIPVLLLRQTA